MFPLRYFTKRFWPRRLFPPPASAPSPGSGGGPFSPRYFVKRFFSGRYFPPASAGAGTTIADAYLTDFIEVPAADRTFVVEAQDRWFTVPATGREFTL